MLKRTPENTKTIPRKLVNIYAPGTFLYNDIGKPSEQMREKLNPPWIPGKRNIFFRHFQSWDSDALLALRAFRIRIRKTSASELSWKADALFLKVEKVQNLRRKSFLLP